MTVIRQLITERGPGRAGGRRADLSGADLVEFDSYDITCRCAVDPVFGTLAGFDGLLAAAHARRLRCWLAWGPTTPPTGTGSSLEPGQSAAGLVREG